MFDFIRDALMKGLTGRTQQQIEDDVSLGKATPYYGPMRADRGDLDKAKHAYASALIDKRFGPVVSGIAGFGKELMDSLPGGTGFDWQDMYANQRGIDLAENQPKKPAYSPTRYAGGLNDFDIFS